MRDIEVSEPTTRPVSTVPSALAHWPEVARELEAGEPVVFLDFDGTLSPLVDEPADATLAPGVAAALHAVASRWTVAVVSGRGAADVMSRIGRDGLWIAGSHGFEIVAPDGTRHDHPGAVAARDELAAAASALEAAVGTVTGVRVERKDLGLTVHDRMVGDADLATVRDAATLEADRHAHLRVTHGKRVTELRPDVDWDKGRAVEWILGRVVDARDVPAVPLYVGDDSTDEDAFVALDERGPTIVVAAGGDPGRPTAARWSLADPDEVRALLERLADIPHGARPEPPSHVD